MSDAAVYDNPEELSPLDALKAARPNCKVAVQTYWGDGLMVCERCALAWSIGDLAPPACKPLTLKRMIDAFEAIANQIETSQRVLVSAGMRPKGHHGELERAQLLRAGMRFVDRLISDDELRRQFQSKRKSDVASRMPEGAG